MLFRPFSGINNSFSGINNPFFSASHTFAVNKIRRCMGAPFSANTDNTLCWVYIFASGRGVYGIGYALDFPDAPDGAADMRIVLRRSFRGVSKALAFKLLLENMSAETIGLLVKYDRENHE